MTKTDPKTKENLQNPRKASRQSQEYKKTRKSPKSEENVLIIVARWLPSCHDGSCLLAKKTINRVLLPLFKSFRNSRTLSTIKEVFGGALRA
ncbi:hypothetical protein QL285_069216 [Trifolium repens]|nr:hypothetical protein QL285_069216 [Trifolium repens]